MERFGAIASGLLMVIALSACGGGDDSPWTAEQEFGFENLYGKLSVSGNYDCAISVAKKAFPSSDDYADADRAARIAAAVRAVRVCDV